jgi:hypothetical protein
MSRPSLTDDGLRAAFISPNVADSNLEPANVVDVIDKLAVYVKAALTSPRPPYGDGQASNVVDVLGGVADGLREIAYALHEIAEAVRQSKSE